MNIACWLVRTAKLFPDKPALYSGTTLVASYEEFATRAASIGAGLREQYSIKPGDRVAIFAKNSTHYLEVLYAIWFAGAVVVPINAKLHPKEAAWIIDNSGATLALGSSDLSNELSNCLPDNCKTLISFDSATYSELIHTGAMLEPVEKTNEDLAWLFYTSGTTGRPKGVMISCGNMFAMAHSYLASVDEVYASDTACYAAPISHGAGLYNIQHVLKGASHCVPGSGGFDPDEIMSISHSLDNLHMFAAPTMVKRFVDRAKEVGYSGKGIRTIVYGGGPMYNNDIIHAVEVLGPKFCQIYGQGESPMTITALSRDMVVERNHDRWRERLASVGYAQSCVEVKIFDQDGKELPHSQVGEIVVRGDTVMSGYWENPKATKSAIKDGWLWTGDVGSMDKDGFLTLKDRSKDVIISGGTNIYPREVEEALLTHHAVEEVSVLGKHDDDWGEIVLAFIVARKGQSVTNDDLDKHCLGEIARFKRPKEYRFVDELPKNNYGKVLKTELRKLILPK